MAVKGCMPRLSRAKGFATAAKGETLQWHRIKTFYEYRFSKAPNRPPSDMRVASAHNNLGLAWRVPRMSAFPCVKIPEPILTDTQEGVLVFAGIRV